MLSIKILRKIHLMQKSPLNHLPLFPSCPRPFVHLHPSLWPPCSSQPPSLPLPAAAPKHLPCLPAPLFAPFQDPDSKLIFPKCTAHPVSPWEGDLKGRPGPVLPSLSAVSLALSSPALWVPAQSLSALPLPTWEPSALASLPPCTTPHLGRPSSSSSLGVTAQASWAPLLQFLIESCLFSLRQLISGYNHALFSADFSLVSVSPADCEVLEGKN